MQDTTRNPLTARRPPTAPAPLVFALADGQVLLRYRDLPPPVPRIGETITLGRSGEKPQRYRVQDVTWMFVAPAPEPEEIATSRQRLESIQQRMENAIANHEFEKARFYSEEERKERENLRALFERLGPQAPPPEVRDEESGPPLREVRITLAPVPDSNAAG